MATPAEQSQSRRSPPAIALQQVSKVYGNGTVALQNLNLAIEPKDFVSLVGPSGCGKSTVLRLMAELGEPSQGRVQWGLPAGDRELAFVFQDAALMPWATVVDNVHLPLKLKGQSLRSCRSRVQESLNRVDLQGVERSYPRQLSGGMKMRVSIARALVTQPNLLLMDEPFGALDEMTRSRLNSDVLRLWERYQWTVVFVTHNIYEAVYLSNRVVVMAARPGRIVADISIDEPHPRTEAFRTSVRFNQYCREILDHLRAAESGIPTGASSGTAIAP
jgi:NitT/TauT family transport system ATP-binding protein